MVYDPVMKRRISNCK